MPLGQLLAFLIYLARVWEREGEQVGWERERRRRWESRWGRRNHTHFFSGIGSRGLHPKRSTSSYVYQQLDSYLETSLAATKHIFCTLKALKMHLRLGICSLNLVGKLTVLPSW